MLLSSSIFYYFSIYLCSNVIIESVRVELPWRRNQHTIFYVWGMHKSPFIIQQSFSLYTHTNFLFFFLLPPMTDKSIFFSKLIIISIHSALYISNIRDENIVKKGRRKERKTRVKNGFNDEKRVRHLNFLSLSLYYKNMIRMFSLMMLLDQYSYMYMR